MLGRLWGCRTRAFTGNQAGVTELKFFSTKDRDQTDPEVVSAVVYMPGGVFDMAVASAFINLLGLAMPLALLQIFDRVIPGSGLGASVWLIIGVGSALVLEALLRMGRSYVGSWMGARFEHLAGCGAFERLLGASIVDFQKMGAGAYLERLNALRLIREFYAGPAIGVIFDLPFVVVYIGAIAYLAGSLALVPIAVMGLFFAVAYSLGRLRKGLETRLQADDRRLGFIIEVLGGIQTVKGLAMEEQMLRRYERLQETCADADYGVSLRHGSTLGLGSLLSPLAVFGVAGFGAGLVLDGTLSVGGLLASIVLAGRAVQPLEGAAGVWALFQGTNLARQRLGEIFAMPAEKPAGLSQLPTIEGAIDLEDLSFGYGKGKDGEDLPPVFQNVDLSVQPGETIGITGESASGKTTLLYLMMGVLTPTAGIARIDGNDLSEYDSTSVRHQVAYLPQEGIMFEGTLLENLTMFRDDLEDDARDIAKLLGLDNAVAKLPGGYEMRVGSAEDKLPRGTRQRIAIARALVDKPRVLLFDEANSFIDGAGDEMLRDLLIKLSGRVTLVMVSQRPSMLEIADRIFDISGASVVERQPQPGPEQAPAEQPEAT